MNKPIYGVIVSNKDRTRWFIDGNFYEDYDLACQSAKELSPRYHERIAVFEIKEISTIKGET